MPYFLQGSPFSFDGKVVWIDESRKTRIPISPKIRLELIAQAENICERCYNYFENKILEIHHIDGDPSNDDSENMMVVCANCHRELTN